MDLDISEFLTRLSSQPRSEKEIADLIYAEIRSAENQKIGFADEIDDQPAYVVEVIDKITTYIFQLQELERKLLLTHLPLDQQTAISDADIRQRIADYIETLKALTK